MFEVKNLSFSYKKNQLILDDVSYSLSKGKMTGLLGSNGSGKSTLIKVSALLTKSNKGEILYDDIDLRKISIRQRAKIISYLGQKLSPSSLLGIETIMLGTNDNHSDNFDKQLYSLIHDMELDSLIFKRTDELSGGEFQKIMLAKALLQNPKVLFLDEPTSSLDIKNQVMFMKQVKEITSDKDMSLLISIHDLNLALKYCDDFLFLSDKRLIYINDKDKITSEFLTFIFKVDMSVVKSDDEFIIKY